MFLVVHKVVSMISVFRCNVFVSMRTLNKLYDDQDLETLTPHRVTRERGPANDPPQYNSLHGSISGLFLGNFLHFELNHSRAAPRLPSPPRVGGSNERLFTLPRIRLLLALPPLFLLLRGS